MSVVILIFTDGETEGQGDKVIAQSYAARNGRAGTQAQLRQLQSPFYCYATLPPTATGI